MLMKKTTKKSGSKTTTKKKAGTKRPSMKSAPEVIAQQVGAKRPPETECNQAISRQVRRRFDAPTRDYQNGGECRAKYDRDNSAAAAELRVKLNQHGS